MRRRPDLFLIGAAKCGTTSFYQYLNGHPQIYMSPRKEPRFFAPDLASGPKGKRLDYPADLDRYLALFEGARRELRVGEASPTYIYSHEAPRLVHEFEPDAFIVVLLRDPIEMMHSLHAHHFAGGTEPIADFEQALAAEDERRRGVGVRRVGNPLLTLYLERGRFGEQLSRWYDAFDRSRIRVIILEELVREPVSSFRNTLEFLNVDPDYQPPSFGSHNPSHRPRSTLVRSLLASRVPQFLFWRALPGLVGERRTRTLVAPFRQLNRAPAGRTSVEPALRRRLQDQLAEDVALLSRLLGRDMAAFWWRESTDADLQRHEPEQVLVGP